MQVKNFTGALGCIISNYKRQNLGLSSSIVTKTKLFPDSQRKHSPVWLAAVDNNNNLIRRIEVIALKTGYLGAWLGASACHFNSESWLTSPIHVPWCWLAGKSKSSVGVPPRNVEHEEGKTWTQSNNSQGVSAFLPARFVLAESKLNSWKALAGSRPEQRDFCFCYWALLDSLDSCPCWSLM